MDVRKSLKNSFSSVRLILAVVLLGGVLSSPDAARGGLRDKLKNAGKNEAPPAEEASPPPEETEAPLPATPLGMREAYLISVPRNEVTLPESSTLAFIEFNHIERRILGDQEQSGICAAQVAAALAQHLADLSRYKVVSRDHIDSILKEQHFSNSGSVNSTTSAKLGKLLGANVLIYGLVQLCATNTEELRRLAENARYAAPELPQIAETPPAGSGLTDDLIGEAKNRFLPQNQNTALFGKLVDATVNKIRSSRQKDGGDTDPLGNVEAIEDPDDSARPRSLILAQVQLIEAETARQILTASLRGEFRGPNGGPGSGYSDRELIARAADDLANRFIDYFLARPELRALELYDEDTWGFEKGIDLIQLGDCARAETYFQDVYVRYKDQMSNAAIAKLMYNHGIALMCSDQPDKALRRLWASLRLTEDPVTTLEAISFTNDTIDRGRRIMVEDDLIVADVRLKTYPVPQLAATTMAPSAGASGETP